MAGYIGDDRYRCPGCRETKPRAEFYVTKSKRTGISHYCKACARERQKGVRARGADAQGSPRGVRGTPYWTRERIIAAIQEWVERYDEIPSSGAWNMSYSGLSAERREVLRQRFKEGDWPGLEQVVYQFGTWRKALSESGVLRRKR